MTLHNATETMKKMTIGGGIGLAGLIVLVILFRIGIVIKDIIFPPKINPPTVAYEILPALQFPPNSTEESLAYSLNTDTGELPQGFPDRLNVFPIIHPEPNFLNLDNAKAKARALKFTTSSGQTSPELALGNAVYEWTEQINMKRKLTIDTITFNFDLVSNYLTYLPAINGRSMAQPEAINATTGFLNSIGLFPADIDMNKTNTPNNPEKYVTYPEQFKIINSQLQPATSLETTKIIRVNLYQKNVTYSLDTGRTSGETTLEIDYPIVYPHPPYSTMSFWIGTPNGSPEVLQSNFFHQQISFPEDVSASYPIKSVEQAYEELKGGKGYIAAYAGDDTQIFIKDVYLAYYLGETVQDYIMPIYIFEGEKGFFGYVSAITDEWAQ